MKLSPALLLVATLGIAGCHVSTDHTVDEAKLRQLDVDWNKAAATHSADAWDAFYSEDAVVLPPNEKIADTPAKIKASVTNFMALPALNVSWTTDKVVIAHDDDMAYIYGSYKMTANDPSGKPINDTGKTVEIWRKRGGEWKCVLDTWNTDTPLS